MRRLAAALYLHGAALGPVAFERRTGGRSADRGEGLGAPHGCVMRALEACHCLSASLACAPRFMLANASVFAVACASHAMCGLVPRLRHSIPCTVVRRTWFGGPLCPRRQSSCHGGCFSMLHMVWCFLCTLFVPLCSAAALATYRLRCTEAIVA